MAFGYAIKVRGGGYLTRADAGKHHQTADPDKAMRYISSMGAIDYAADLARARNGKVFEVVNLEDGMLVVAWQCPPNSRDVVDLAAAERKAALAQAAAIGRGE